MIRLRSFRPRALAIAAGLAALALLPGRASADIFTYTDAEGVVHFANKPKGDGRFQVYIKSASPSKHAAGAAVTMPSDASSSRFTRYAEWIRQASILYQIPEALIRAIIKCESDYDARAVSPAGALGLMQMIPPTALRMQVRDAFDPR